MYKKLISGATLLALIIGWTACNKKEERHDPLSSSWLLPLVKGSITPLNITTLNNKSFTTTLRADALGLSNNTSITNPNQTTLVNVGSYELETNDLIHQIQLDTCLLDITLTNYFQVALLPGTQIAIRTGPSTAPIARFHLDSAIANGSSFMQRVDLSQHTIPKNIYFTIDTLIIDSFSNQTFSDSIRLDVHIPQVSVHTVDLSTNESFRLADTTEFDGSSLEYDINNPHITDSFVNAQLTVRGLNELPINCQFQIKFLNPSGMVIDSMFVPQPFIQGGNYQGQILVNAQPHQYQTTINKVRLDRIKDATQVVYFLDLNTNGYAGSTIRVTRDYQLDMKVIGDIKIVLNPFTF